MKLLERLWVFIFLVIALTSYSVLIYHMIDLKCATDFILLYHSTKNFLSGHPIYGVIPWQEYHLTKEASAVHHIAAHFFTSGKNFNANLNTPAHLLFIWPFALLSYGWALALWSFLAFACGAFGVFLINQKIFGYLKNPLAFWIGLSLFFACFFTFANISLGQIGFVSFFLIISAWYLARDNKDTAAGIVLGVLLSLKLFFGTFILFFLLQKRWRLVIMSTIIFLGAHLLLFIFSGKNVFINYWDLITHISWYDRNWNASWFGFVFRLSAKVMPGSVIIMPSWGKVLYYTGILPLAVIFWRLCRAQFANIAEYDYAFCYSLIISLFISPLGWIYYFAIFFLPAAILIRYLASVPHIKTTQIFFATFCMGLLLYPSSLDVYFKPTVWLRLWPDSVNFFGLLAFLIFWLAHHKVLTQDEKQPPVKNYWPWLALAYLITLPGLMFLVYVIFLRHPPVWE